MSRAPDPCRYCGAALEPVAGTPRWMHPPDGCHIAGLQATAEDWNATPKPRGEYDPRDD